MTKHPSHPTCYKCIIAKKKKNPKLKLLTACVTLCVSTSEEMLGISRIALNENCHGTNCAITLHCIPVSLAKFLNSIESAAVQLNPAE